MTLFFHHVGQVGAEEDFKKTVYANIDIEVVESNIPAGHPLKSEILYELRTKFPSGYFNCWGVPAGAQSVIRNLSEGDYVVLVESATEYGEAPVLCHVQAFWDQEFRDLSLRLWGNDKYPYVFFFHTELLDLSWPEFREHLGYKDNFDPRGNFYSVESHRLDDFGGVEAYVEYLRGNYSMRQRSIPSITEEVMVESGVDTDLNTTEIEEEIESGRTRLTETPQLTEGLEPQRRTVSMRPRDAAFAIEVKKAYGFRCAICGKGLQAPTGEFEVQSAHIYPKSHDGSDDYRNGICLCRIHHWALDVGWIAVADDYTVLIRDGLPAHEDYDIIRDFEGRKISLPSDEAVAPDTLFLREHRKLKNFK